MTTNTSRSAAAGFTVRELPYPIEVRSHLAIVDGAGGTVALVHVLNGRGVETARELAAAPEMRLALERALRFIPEDAMVYSEGTHGDRVYVKDAVRAALAQARVESAR